MKEDTQNLVMAGVLLALLAIVMTPAVIYLTLLGHKFMHWLIARGW